MFYHERETFGAMKEALCKSPVIALPDFEYGFCIKCDAFDVAIGDMLS